MSDKVPPWAKVNASGSFSFLPSASARNSLMQFSQFPTTDFSSSESKGHQNLIEGANKIRDLIIQRRPGRAMRQMEFLPNFNKDLQKYIYNTVQKEAEEVKVDKETSVAGFNRESLAGFSYDLYHKRILENHPILSAALTGAVSNLTFEDFESPSRKGFGGSRKDESISLKPVICQTASRLLHNKHPRCVTQLQCLNSALNTTQHVAGKAIAFANALGDCFSKKTSLKLVENLVEGHDASVVDMRDRVENLWKDDSSKRVRRTKATETGTGGFSIFADNVGKIITPRHNTGIDNQGQYLQMTITLSAANRIPSSHMSDKPMLPPSEVNYFPTAADITRMSLWMKDWIAKQVVKYHSAFKSSKKYISSPDVKFSQKMAQKSTVKVLALDLEDPASSEGMINVGRRLVPYLPTLPTNRKQKTPVFGDQGFFERGYHSVWGLCSEKKLEDRLDGLVFLPQEWHKKREDLFIYNQIFNLPHQLTQAGTLQNIKASFNHNKASKDVSHFYASWDLMEVTTLINLLQLVSITADKEMGCADANYSKEEFSFLIDKIFQDINLFTKWGPVLSKEEVKELFAEDVSCGGAGDVKEDRSDDEVLVFHKDLVFRGVLQCAQKLATQFGDCLALISFWKNSMADYHDSKKWKYRIAAFTKVAAADGVFGEKIKTDSVYNCLINDQGLKDSNVDGDLKVEHVNKMFKAGLLNLAGNYNQENLRRVALTMDLSENLEDKLYPNYVESEEPVFKMHLGHRNVDWSDQVKKGVLDMKEQEVYKYCPGRKVQGYKKPAKLDLQGIKRFIKKQSKELKLHIQETY